MPEDASDYEYGSDRLLRVHDRKPPAARPALHESARGDAGELLEDIPPAFHHRGRFEGLTAGRTMQRWLCGALVLCGIAVVGAGFREYHRSLALERSPYELPPELQSEGAARELWWSEGRARLGLARKAPGIEVIHLPDREIRLAPGCDVAQLWVDVVNGHTRKIQPIYGEIVEQTKPRDVPDP